MERRQHGLAVHPHQPHHEDEEQRHNHQHIGNVVENAVALVQGVAFLLFLFLGSLAPGFGGTNLPDLCGLDLPDRLRRLGLPGAGVIGLHQLI